MYRYISLRSLAHGIHCDYATSRSCQTRLTNYNHEIVIRFFPPFRSAYIYDTLLRNGNFKIGNGVMRPTVILLAVRFH